MTALDSVLSIMAKKDTVYGTSAWDVFKSTLDLYLCAGKLEPHRTDAISAVAERVTIEFAHGRDLQPDDRRMTDRTA